MYAAHSARNWGWYILLAWLPTLLVGDHLFVDKLTYGPRVPMTPFSYPIVHNSFAPIFDVKSYTEIQTIPYTRLPGFRDIERNDVL